nr:nitronate monooxygenase [Lachnospiraceae bacterium]
MESLIIGNKSARLPIIQGGMGVGVSLSGLAGAVAASGGIGVISAAQIGFDEPDFYTNCPASN